MNTNKAISEHELDDKLAQMPNEMTPKRDLWSGIERAIATTEQQKSISSRKNIVIPTAWAASVLAAVLLTWVTLGPQGVNNPLSANLASVMQSDFEKQKQLMLTSFGQPALNNLSEDMQTQLKELSSARTAINSALKNDPENSELLNLLRWTQKQELDLLKQIYSPQWQTI